MASLRFPSSFEARIAGQLEACDQPLIQLWGWPWSGKRGLLEGWMAAQPGKWAELDPGAIRGESALPRTRFWIATGPLAAPELLAAAEVLGSDQRLVIPVDRRLEDEILPLRTLEPSHLRLLGREIEEMFPGARSARVDELRRLSDGWPGPLLWLRESWEVEQSLERAIFGQAFAARFEQEVLSLLDSGLLEAMTECSVTEELDPGLWRRVWADQGDRLTALERLVGGWGWLITAPAVPPRLPRLLRQAVRSRYLKPDRERRTYVHLGRAAHALGLAAKAELYLRLAGDSQRLTRLSNLGLETGSTGSAASPAGDRFGPAHEGAPRFSLQLLGQPLVKKLEAAGEETELSFRLRRALWSVAFLALCPGRRATKDELVDAVWREAPEDAIRKNFHPTLSEARRTLGPRDVFVLSQGSYTLNPDFGWWIDCERFRDRIEAGRRILERSPGEPQPALEAWLEAWSLYGGHLLAGVDAPWIRPLREQYYQDYIELLRGVGDLSARLERRTQALDAYRSLLLEEPFEERVHLAVMELYSRQGRRDLVRRQFVRMQELLRGELNVEPLEETQERYHQLMR